MDLDLDWDPPLQHRYGALQEFLEANVWLLGLDYTKMRPRYPVLRGTVDFVLERFDGFHDLLELKDPTDAIIVAPDAEDAPPSASRYSLSPALARALAQVLRRARFTGHLVGERGDHATAA